MGTKVNILIFGAKASGKTQIFNRITKPNYTFESHHLPTLSMSFARVNKGNYELSVWDVTGPEFSSHEISAPDIAIYCVDLSKPLNTETIDTIKKNIKSFRKSTLSKPAEIILVGTKADSARDEYTSEFDQLASDPACGFKRDIKISSKENTNTAELLALIHKLIEEMHPEQFLISNKSDSFFNHNNTTTTKSKLPWEMSACEIFSWFCLPIVGWAYLAYYFIFNSSGCATAEADDSDESYEDSRSSFTDSESQFV